MNRIFLSQAIPNSQIKRYNLSQAANNFCLHINGIGCFSKHIAVPPGNVDGSFKSFREEDTGIEYHLCRPFVHHGAGKIANIFLDNLWLYFRVIKTKEKNVWFYNVWTGNILSYLLVRFFSNKRTYILLADYNPSRYKGYVGKLLLWALNRAKGIISLSARCSEVNRHFKAIPGIIPENKINEDVGIYHGNKTFLLSGTLNKNTGLDLALDVFKDLPEVTLYLTGSLSGNNEKKVEKYAEKYSNIVYKGFFEHFEDYLDFLQSVDFVLSLRNPDSAVNHYNFPSKILETLAYNKIVVSTIQYPELGGINYLIAPYSVEGLGDFIKTLLRETEVQQIQKCLDNTDVLKEKYTEKAWIKAFDEIENINCNI